jgi:hypothetical protein
MNYMRRLILIILFLSPIVWARGYSPGIEDSLRSIHPRMRAGWLKSKGIEYSRYSKPFFPDSQNVRCVGRWSYGPSYEITGETIGNNTYLFLSRGSGVSVLKFVSSDSIELLSDINASGLVMQAVVKDSLLFLGCYDFGIDIYNITNLQNPERINVIITPQNDFFIKDTFLYLIGTDTFKIFNISNPLSPYLLGSVADSGYSIYVSGNYAYLGARWGLYILDVTDPRNPVRINTLSGGAQVKAIWVEDTLCYYTISNPESKFVIANVADPHNPSEVGSLNNVSGIDIYKIGYFVYLPAFDIIDVSIPSFPARISHLDLPGWDNGVWVNSPFGHAFVADDWEGLQVINISDPTNPQADTSLLKADYSYDVVVDTNYAYVANNYCGLKIIDISYPEFPLEVGAYDTIGQIPRLETATAKDSFAFIPQWWAIEFRSIDVSDPSRPRLAGINSQGFIQTAGDMILKDSFVYVAKNYRFEIYNISNPRQPRLMGSCNSLDMAGGLFIKDTFAYVAAGAFGLGIINIANPTNPYLVSTTPGHQTNSWGIAVRDTFAYIPSAYDSLWVLSVANPSSVYSITSAWLGNHHGYDIVLSGRYAYVGCYDFRVFDISVPAQPSLVGYYTTPSRVRRVFADSEYVYAACFAGGMSVFKNELAGIKEADNKKAVSYFSFFPNPVRSKGYLFINNVILGSILIDIYDISGRKLKEYVLRVSNLNHKQKVNLDDLPDGILLFRIKQGNKNKLIKVIKMTGR